MIKHIPTLLVLAPFVLVGCFGSDEPEPVSAITGLETVTTSRFTLDVPASWREVTKEELSSPAAGEFELAYRSEIPRQGFYNNLVLLSEPRVGTGTTLTFVDGVVVRDARQYATFESLGKELVDLADGQETIIHTFRAKYNSITGEYIYLQSGALCSDKAYILTIGLHQDTSEEDLARYKSIIPSFNCLGSGIPNS